MGKQYRGPQTGHDDQSDSPQQSQGQGQGQGGQREVKTGTVKRLVADKGFGFIRTSNGQEHFFHRSGVVNDGYDDLQEGDLVTFVQGATGPKGLRAEQVQRTDVG